MMVMKVVHRPAFEKHCSGENEIKMNSHWSVVYHSKHERRGMVERIK